MSTLYRIYNGLLAERTVLRQQTPKHCYSSVFEQNEGPLAKEPVSGQSKPLDKFLGHRPKSEPF